MLTIYVPGSLVPPPVQTVYLPPTPHCGLGVGEIPLMVCPSPPRCGLGGGVGQACLPATIHPGPATEYCIRQHRVCRHAANRDMEASVLAFPLISFDFLKKTEESACQALVPPGGDPIRRGVGSSDTGDWDIYVPGTRQRGGAPPHGMVSHFTAKEGVI